MKAKLFISDLHLCSSRPQINRIFFDFIERIAPSAEALYILGDLFEYWAGDDDLVDPLNASVAAALRQLRVNGTAIYLLHGNRDFLLGANFAAASHAELLPDPTLLDLYGTPTLLLHGDTLCTDDIAYQTFRLQVREATWQQQFLAQPLTQRKAQIEQLRQQSNAAKTEKSAEIMDVAPTAVEQLLRQFNYPRLIHGHTHRPARHVHSVDGRACERWVLADWYERGSYLRCDAAAITAVALELPTAQPA